MKREDDRAYRCLVITLALIVAQIHNLGFAERLLAAHRRLNTSFCLIVVTANQKEFDRVSGLVMESWRST